MSSYLVAYVSYVGQPKNKNNTQMLRRCSGKHKTIMET